MSAPDLPSISEMNLQDYRLSGCAPTRAKQQMRRSHNVLSAQKSTEQSLKGLESPQSYGSVGIQMGLNKVGYYQLREAIDAERKGKQVNLTVQRPPSWNLKMQVDKCENRRKGILKNGTTLQQAYTGQLAGGGLWRARTRQQDLPLPASKLSKLQAELKGSSSALDQIKLTREGLAILPKTRTMVNIHDYSVTTQGVEQNEQMQEPNKVNGLKVPNMELTDYKAIQQRRELLRNQQNPRPIEHRLLEITKNSNLKTREKWPDPSDTEKRFRAYVDRQVDSLCCLSTSKILGRLRDQNQPTFTRVI